MNPEKLFEKIGEADESFVAEAAAYKKRPQGASLFLRLAAAACFVLVAAGSIWAVRNMQDYDGGAENGAASESVDEYGERLVADFLSQFTSLFSFGYELEPGLYDNFWVWGLGLSQTTEAPLVRWNRFNFIDIDGEIISDAPFIWEDTRIASNFFLQDLGVGVPVITVTYHDFRRMWLEPRRNDDFQHWQMFQHVDGEFVVVEFAESYDFAPKFFRGIEDYLIMFTGMTENDENELWRVELNDGVLEIISGVYDPRGESLIETRMYELERQIDVMMESPFGANFPRLWSGILPIIENDERHAAVAAHQDRWIAYARDLVEPFNRISLIFRHGMMGGGGAIETVMFYGKEYDVLTPTHIAEGGMLLPELHDFIGTVFFGSWAEHFQAQLDPSANQGFPLFMEIDGVLVQSSTFRTGGVRSALPLYINSFDAEYVRTTQDSVFVRYEVWFEDGLHTMLAELIYWEYGPRIINLELEIHRPDVSPEALEDELIRRHDGALTGAIVIYGDGLYLDPVDVVWLSDAESMAAHGLSEEDFTRVYYLVHSDTPETTRFTITFDTEFVFVDSGLIISPPLRRDRRIYTNNLHDFKLYLLPHELDPATIGSPTLRRIVYFVRVNDAGEVVSVTQEFGFTQ